MELVWPAAVRLGEVEGESAAALALTLSRPDGAVDCIVVRVVVKLRSEWLGEENVLLRPSPSRLLSPPPIVFEVPALEKPASEWIVSGFVARVGAADLLLRMGAVILPLESLYELVKLVASDRGVLKDRRPLAVLLGPGRWRWPDSGYGLLFFEWK